MIYVEYDTKNARGNSISNGHKIMSSEYEEYLLSALEG